jgi:hypothetical protein
MFKDRRTALAVRETILMLGMLITRSYTLVVLPSKATQEEKDNYRTFADKLASELQAGPLEQIALLHPDLRTQLLTISMAIESGDR